MYYLYVKSPFWPESPLQFSGNSFLTGKHIFYKSNNHFRSQLLISLCLPKKANLYQTLQLLLWLLLLNFILLVQAQLFRLSKQFQILVLGSSLLTIPPSCVTHKFENVSSTKNVDKMLMKPSQVQGPKTYPWNFSP